MLTRLHKVAYCDSMQIYRQSVRCFLTKYKQEVDASIDAVVDESKCLTVRPRITVFWGMFLSVFCILCMERPLNNGRSNHVIHLSIFYLSGLKITCKLLTCRISF